MPWVGVASTVPDMFRFAEMLRRRGELDGTRILSPATLEVATRNWTGEKPNELYKTLFAQRGWPAAPAYLGLGFALRGTAMCHHLYGTLTSSGTFGNYGAGSALYWVDPARELTFVCLSAGVMNNLDNIERFQRLSDIAVSAVLARPGCREDLRSRQQGDDRHLGHRARRARTGAEGQDLRRHADDRPDTARGSPPGAETAYLAHRLVPAHPATAPRALIQRTTRAIHARRVSYRRSASGLSVWATWAPRWPRIWQRPDSTWWRRTANPEALERFCSTVPCERAQSLRQLGRSCRVVITMLPDGAAVRQVLLGAEGIAAGLAAGAVILDMSSAEPVGTRTLAAGAGANRHIPGRRSGVRGSQARGRRYAGDHGRR